MFSLKGNVVSDETFAAYATRKRSEFQQRAGAIRTVSERLADTREQRNLERMNSRLAEWKSLSDTVATQVKRPHTSSVVTHAEGHRERLEVNDILYEATPDGVKSPDHFWYSTLRKPKVDIAHTSNRYFYNLRRSEDLALYTNNRPKTGKGWQERPYLKDRFVLLKERISSLTPASMPVEDFFCVRGVKSRP